MAKRAPITNRLGTDAFFSEPVSQDTSKSTQQETGILASQLAGPAKPELVKATFYLTPDLILKLEELRMERLRRGEKVDKSALVREALDRLAG
jgi:hypothetical protein